MCTGGDGGSAKVGWGRGKLCKLGSATTIGFSNSFGPASAPPWLSTEIACPWIPIFFTTALKPWSSAM